MKVSQGSGVCAALCIRRTLCRHVTIGTPMVIFCCLTVFWLFFTVFDEWYTVPIVKNTQNHWCTNRHRFTKTVLTVYQQCTNRQKQPNTVKNSQKTVKTAQQWPSVYQSSHVYTQSLPNTQSPRPRQPNTQSRLRAVVLPSIANGNKTYPNLLVFKNNNMARGSRGFVC